MTVPPNFCCSECAGRVSVAIRSPRRRIAERFRSAAMRHFRLLLVFALLTGGIVLLVSLVVLTARSQGALSVSLAHRPMSATARTVQFVIHNDSTETVILLDLRAEALLGSGTRGLIDSSRSPRVISKATVGATLKAGESTSFHVLSPTAGLSWRLNVSYVMQDSLWQPLWGWCASQANRWVPGLVARIGQNPPPLSFTSPWLLHTDPAPNENGSL